MAKFIRLFGVDANTSVLDVGGHAATWAGLPHPPKVTMLNRGVEDFGEMSPACVIGDGRNLPFEDGAFEVAFSNSVIEHLENRRNQEQFAAEIARVSKYYYVQTPNRWFFIEPHLMAPFIHFLPVSWQRCLIRNFSIWGLVTRPTRRQIEDFLNEVRLLSVDEMQSLFPDAVILKEKIAGFTKSLMAVRAPHAIPDSMVVPKSRQTRINHQQG
jgi:SAM-dependent methyltransferase